MEGGDINEQRQGEISTYTNKIDSARTGYVQPQGQQTVAGIREGYKVGTRATPGDRIANISQPPACTSPCHCLISAPSPSNSKE